MPFTLPEGPVLARGIALALASGVALAWAVRRDTLPRAALRWLLPPAAAIGCIVLWRGWPRGWAIAACLVALPLLVAVQVLVAAIAGQPFRRSDDEDDEAAIHLTDGYLALTRETAAPVRDPIGEFWLILGACVVFCVVFCGAVLARLAWRLAPRATGGAGRAVLSSGACALLLATSAALAVAGEQPSAKPTTAAVKGVSPEAGQAWVEARARLVAQAPHVSWLHMRTPLLPLAWPPASDTAWVRYHYASGGEPGLLDAVWIAHPFARETVARDGRSLRIERLPGLRLDRQGVQPLSGARVGPTSADADRVALVLDAPPGPGAPGIDVLREVHRQYWSAHGVLRAGLEPAHRAFFAWLDQAGGSGTP